MAKWLITGSVAMYHWFPESRVPGDIDIITPVSVHSETPSKLAVDAHWYPVAERILEVNRDPTFVDPNMLYTIKVSHAAWDVKWEKTMYAVEFLGLRGCRIEHRDIFDDLVAYWETVHGKKHVNLNQSNDAFFTEHVHRKIDHDTLHELVAYPDQPAHTKIRDNINSPMCSETLWTQLPFGEKLRTASEEVIVIALERYIDWSSSSKSQIFIGLSKAYKNLVTTMTTGWFNLFLIEFKTIIFKHLQTCLSHILYLKGVLWESRQKLEKEANQDISKIRMLTHQDMTEFLVRK